MLGLRSYRQLQRGWGSWLADLPSLRRLSSRSGTRELLNEAAQESPERDCLTRLLQADGTASRIAVLNEATLEAKHDISGRARLPKALGRVALFSTSLFTLLALLPSLSGRGPYAAAAFFGGIVPALSVLRLGFLAADRAAKQRKAWNQAVRHLNRWASDQDQEPMNLRPAGR